MTSRENQYRAYFTLVGEFDPREVSDRLGLQPSCAWKKGEVNPKTQMERKFSRWSLDSRLAETVSLEEQITDVLSQLREKRLEVAELRSEVDGVMQLVGYFYQNYPGFSLDDETVAELAKLKLGIDCDFYYLYSDQREDS